MASRLLAIAAFKDGKYVQSFPFFGVERRGAPVAAYTRISDAAKIATGHNLGSESAPTPLRLMARGQPPHQ